VLPGPGDFAAYAAMEGVPSALAATRDGIDALLRDRGLRRTTPELTAESLLRGAVASAALDGSSATAEDVRAGRADEVASGAARLNSQLLSLVPVIARSPLQALARMHSLVAPAGTPPDQVGRPRGDSSITVGLQSLARQLLASTGAPSLAVASLAHAEVLKLAPFEVGSGLVARALERLLLVARGVDPASLTVPEGGHLAAGPAYDEALRAYSEGGPAGARQWLLYAADALTVGASLNPAGP
jgi:hypothetical protein